MNSSCYERAPACARAFVQQRGIRSYVVTPKSPQNHRNLMTSLKECRYSPVVTSESLNRAMFTRRTICEAQ
jgi:hypothetical protein